MTIAANTVIPTINHFLRSLLYTQLIPAHLVQLQPVLFGPSFWRKWIYAISRKWIYAIKRNKKSHFLASPTRKGNSFKNNKGIDHNLT